MIKKLSDVKVTVSNHYSISRKPIFAVLTTPDNNSNKTKVIENTDDSSLTTITKKYDSGSKTTVNTNGRTEIIKLQMVLGLSYQMVIQ